LIDSGDLREEVARTALDQEWMARAPVILVLAGVYDRTTSFYGERGERYVVFESGCAAQNVQLQTAVLELGSVVVGAFDDLAASRLLRLPEWERPLAILPVGWPVEERGGSC
jgi:SagB-type dehydrogenase family enzyme